MFTGITKPTKRKVSDNLMKTFQPHTSDPKSINPFRKLTFSEHNMQQLNLNSDIEMNNHNTIICQEINIKFYSTIWK